MSVDLAAVDIILERYPAQPSSLVMVLQDLQVAYNYLPREVLRKVSQALNVPLSKTCSVATFYRAFSLEPRGKTIVKVCTGTACHVRGAPRLVEHLSRELEAPIGGTTPDMSFTLETVNCVGACALGPVVLVNEDYHGQMTFAKLNKMLKQHREQTKAKG